MHSSQTSVWGGAERSASKSAGYARGRLHGKAILPRAWELGNPAGLCQFARRILIGLPIVRSQAGYMRSDVPLPRSHLKTIDLVSLLL